MPNGQPIKFYRNKLIKIKAIERIKNNVERKTGRNEKKKPSGLLQWLGDDKSPSPDWPVLILFIR